MHLREIKKNVGKGDIENIYAIYDLFTQSQKLLLTLFISLFCKFYKFKSYKFCF